jgi:hypothetical protein
LSGNRSEEPLSRGRNLRVIAEIEPLEKKASLVIDVSSTAVGERRNGGAGRTASRRKQCDICIFE